MYSYKYLPTVEATMLAYCDCFFPDNKQEVAMKLRSLQFCGEQFMPLAQWAALMKAATPFNYNNFDAGKVEKVLKKLAKENNLPLAVYRLCPGREWSVVMYISIQNPKVLGMLRRVDVKKLLDADDTSITTIHDKKVFRVWWD